MSEVKTLWDGSDDERALQEYRPVSVTAFLSLLTGVLCLGSIWIPALSLFGLISIVFALVTAFSVRVRPLSLVWLSYIGVFLSVAGMVWALTGRSFYQNHVIAAGQERAEQWLKLLVENKINEAICLRMQPMERPLEGIDLNEYFSRTVNPPTASEMAPPPSQMKDMFLESRTVRYMVESGPQTKITLLPEKTIFSTSNPGRATVEAFFDVDFLLTDSLGQGRRTSAELSVVMHRHNYYTGVQWQVFRITNHTSPDPLPAGMMAPTTGGQMPPDADEE